MSTIAVSTVVAIVGPTASGKSGLAMRLAERFGGEIVNADALQAYRGLDIGTAKPSPDDRRRVPHHLLDILEPDEIYSAGEFARRAREVLRQLAERQVPAWIVGGSGLYLRALLEGISPLPPKDSTVRGELEERLDREGLPALYDELERVDPVAHQRIPRGDSQRILRALEVARSTGRTLTDWQRETPFGRHPIDAVRIGLTLPRTILYDRIDDRVRSMLRSGWIAEVEDLLQRGWQPSTRAFQAIGYRQLVQHLLERASLDECLDEICRATRRYAKRQETWFRKERDITWFSAEDPKALTSSVIRLLSNRSR